MDSTIQLLLNWGQDNTLLGSCHIFITKCTHIYNILFYGWYFFKICIYVLLRGKINFLSSRWNDSNYYRIRGAKNYFVALSTLRDLSKIRDLKQRRFWGCTSTGSCPFSFLGDGFAQIFSQIVSIRVKKLSNTNYIASRHITREKSSLPVDVRCSKTSLLKLPISRGGGRWKQREGHIGHWSCRGSPTEKKEVLYLVKKLGRNRRVGLSMLSSKMYVYSITKNQLEISFAFS